MPFAMMKKVTKRTGNRQSGNYFQFPSPFWLMSTVCVTHVLVGPEKNCDDAFQGNEQSSSNVSG